MSTDPKDPAAKKAEDELPATSLADLVRAAQTRLGPEPDKVTPAALKTMAAVVRDLKGMPEIVVTRESQHKIKLGRRGKIGSLTIEFKANIRALELGYVGWPGADPTTTKLRRYVLDQEQDPPTVWNRLEGGGELIGDIREALMTLYPELSNT